jgi:hypothetical protein
LLFDLSSQSLNTRVVGTSIRIDLLCNDSNLGKQLVHQSREALFEVRSLAILVRRQVLIRYSLDVIDDRFLSLTDGWLALCGLLDC